MSPLPPVRFTPAIAAVAGLAATIAAAQPVEHGKPPVRASFVKGEDSLCVNGWDDTKDIKYRLLHGEKASFEGLVRRNPADKEEIVLAALSCNSNKDRGLR